MLSCLLRPEHPEYQQARARANGRVRQVESVPVVGTCIEINEISDAARTDAIKNIPEGATEDEGDTRSRVAVLLVDAPEQPGQDEHRDDGHCDQCESAVLADAVLKNAERNAGILRMDEVQKPRDNYLCVPGIEPRLAQPLGAAVQAEHAQG